MDERTAALRRIDPKTLGARVRAARLRRGLTQSELSGVEFTVSHLSRIESGKRRPNLRILQLISTRLECDLATLLEGFSNAAEQSDRLSIEFAELALANGDPVEALAQISTVLQSAAMSESPLRFRAEEIKARALEATGQLDAAVDVLEGLLSAGNAGSLQRAGAAMVLCRCHREHGDLSQAINAGEDALTDLGSDGLEGTDEYVELTVTVASAHFALGNTHRAVRMCRAAVAAADALSSPRARAAAYWNSSVMESERGNFDSALPLATRALALLSAGNDARNVARLRSQLANLCLQSKPPQIAEAMIHFERADVEMRSSGSSTVDIARNQIGLARAALIHGDVAKARRLVDTVRDGDLQEFPTLNADALLLSGRIRLIEGDVAAAASDFLDAVRTLSAIGSDRAIAQIWMDVAAHLETVGESEAALDAYRRAAISTGLAFSVPSENVPIDRGLTPA